MRKLLPVAVITSIGLLECVLSQGGRTGGRGKKPPVGVFHEGKDAVGRRFALAPTERITASPRYRLAEGEAEAAQIVMTSIDGDTPAQGRHSSVAVLLSYSIESRPCPSIDLVALLVGSTRVTGQAERLLSILDQHASEFRFACDH